jgi:hypothetical protein
MATSHKEIEIKRSKEFVWDAIRDVGAIHKRLVPGFVTDCMLEGSRAIGEMIQQGLNMMKRTLESGPTGGT